MGNPWDEFASTITGQGQGDAGDKSSSLLGLGGSGGVFGSIVNAMPFGNQTVQILGNIGSGNGGLLGDALATAAGLPTQAQRETASNNASYISEQNARASLLNDALKDPSLDPQTRDEIKKLYESGGRSDQIAAQLNAAREGNGIYAVRKLKQNEEMILRSTPGRKQILSLGNNSVLGSNSILGTGGSR